MSNHSYLSEYDFLLKYWPHSGTGQFLGVNINSAHIYARATIFMFALFALAHSSAEVDSHPPCMCTYVVHM